MSLTLKAGQIVKVEQGDTNEKEKTARDNEVLKLESEMWRLERRIDGLKTAHGDCLKRHQQLMQQIREEEEEKAQAAKAEPKTKQE